jgi:glutamate racemase
MSRPSERAIAVFDSGVGGLTVFKALRKRMPNERLIYFGDTARLPYGSKSPGVVRRFSVEIARFLSRRDIKLFVIACNSASAMALGVLRKELKVPVLDVIDPAVRSAAQYCPSGRIGVIGTAATIKSGAYQKALAKATPRKHFPARACPLLVPLVEEGWWEHRVTRQVAREYLEPFTGGAVSALILGCTHYPLIKPLLQKTVGAGTRLIDSGEEVSRVADRLLRRKGLRRASGRGSEAFYVSDGAERFKNLLQRILGGRRRRVRVVRFPF